MALLTAAQLEEIRKIIRDASQAVAISTMGIEISDDELQRLIDEGYLDPDQVENLVLDSFEFGQLMEKLPNAKNMTLGQFKDYLKKNPIKHSAEEKLAIQTAQNRAGDFCVGLGTRYSGEVTTEAVRLDSELASQFRQGIRDETAKTLANREGVSKLRTRLRQMSEDWARDWDRIASTESHLAHQQGFFEQTIREYGHEQMMAKVPEKTACDDCKRLYLGPDGKPIVHPASWWEGQGTSNVGLKRMDWKPVLGAMHPWCQCQLVTVPDGFAFDDNWDLVPEEMIEKARKAARPISGQLGLFHGHGPYIGPRGGKWADAAHTIPWDEKKHTKTKSKPSPVKQWDRSFGAMEKLREKLSYGAYITTGAWDLYEWAPAFNSPEDLIAAVELVHKLGTEGIEARDREAYEARKKRTTEETRQLKDYLENEKKTDFLDLINNPAPVIDSSVSTVASGEFLGKSAHKLHYRTEFQGLPISIENRKGSKRYWYDPHTDTKGETLMHYPYGYIRLTEGVDGDHVDCYIGPHSDAPNVHIVHQLKAPLFKKYDEDKVMLGFLTQTMAKRAYLKHFDDPRFFGSMTTMSLEKFKEKIEERKNRGKMLKAFPGQAGIVGLDRPVGSGGNRGDSARVPGGEPFVAKPDPGHPATKENREKRNKGRKRKIKKNTKDKFREAMIKKTGGQWAREKPYDIVSDTIDRHIEGNRKWIDDKKNERAAIAEKERRSLRPSDLR